MSDRRIYLVRVERAVYVLAESEQQAEDWCLGEGAWDVEDGNDAEAHAVEVTDTTHVPASDADSPPWVALADDLDAADAGLTVGEWLARGGT